MFWGSLLSWAWGSQVAPKGSQGVWVEWEREGCSCPRADPLQPCPAPTLPVSSSARRQLLAKEVTASPAFPWAPRGGRGLPARPPQLWGDRDPPPSKRMSLRRTPGEGATCTWEEKHHATLWWGGKCTGGPREGGVATPGCSPGAERQNVVAAPRPERRNLRPFLPKSRPGALGEHACSRQGPAAAVRGHTGGWASQQPGSSPAPAPLSERRAPGCGGPEGTLGLGGTGWEP